MFQRVRRGPGVTVGGQRRQVSLINVKDVIRTLTSAAATTRTMGQTYCLAHPEPVHWADFALEVGRIAGRKPILASVPTGVGSL